VPAFTKVRPLSTTAQYLLLAPASSLGHMTSWAESDLRKAINADQFVCHFQPKVDLRTRAVLGFEALSRWKHPQQGLISPASFIAVLEKTGLSHTFTARMLRKVFAEARDFLPESMFVSVNISPPQMLGGSLPAVIQRASEEEGFPLHRLVLEITETALLDDLERARASAKGLKSLGVRLAIDDFGTGYSSLHHLQVLPFDEIKIDMSFVRSMLHERESRKIVAALVGLGYSLGMITVAEGVEETAQAAMLISMGCDRGQGWLYGKPAPASELTDMIAPLSGKGSGHRIECPNEGDTCANLESYPAQRLAQLQAIYDGAPVGLCFVDSRLRFVSINERLAALNSRTVPEHLGRSVGEIVPDVFQQVKPHLQRALEGESIQDLEVIIPGASPSDADRIVLATCQPARDEAGEVVGVSVAVVDITARKQMEEALRRSEAYLKAVFNAVPVGIMIADASDGRIIAANRQAAKILRRPLDSEGMPSAYDQWVAPGAAGQQVEPSEYPIARALLRGESIHDEELFCERADGSWAWVSLSARPIIGSDGRVEGSAVTVREIDELNRMNDSRKERLHS
jgi:PAS domain S-box-containing protein